MMTEHDTRKPGGEPYEAESRSAIAAERRRRRERSCVGCRETTAPDELIRVVLGPDGQVVPDLGRRAHGRGAWVHPRPACLVQAAKRGLPRSFRAPVKTTPEELWTMIRVAADRRVESLVSAAWRARKLELGSDAVKDALAAGRARLVLVATDARAAADTPGVERALAAGHVRAWGTKAILGRATGRAELGVAAVLDEGLAEALSSTLQMAQMPAPGAVGSRNARSGDSTEVG
jgi:predicted RNA-binding protein YlxR (DUF448 family)/ribosomal protein L30E